MKLKEFLKKYYPNNFVKYNYDIVNIKDHDKFIVDGDIFVSLKGTNYIDSAIKFGAKSIVLEKGLKIKKKKGINYIFVDSPIVFLARVVNEVLNNLDKKIIFVGITGTSGKTTSLNLLYEVLKYEGYDILAIGTHFIYSYFGLKEEKYDTCNTTISLSRLYNLLKDKDFNYDYVIMEVSSEGIMNSRVLGLSFDVVSVTNVTKEHLNFHNTLNEYILAKEKLLYQASNYIVLNNDDFNLSRFKDSTINKIITYGINSGDVSAKYIEYKFDKTIFYIEDNKTNYYINTNLLGQFNVYNILNVWCILKCLNINKNLFLNYLKKKIVVSGRMNIINKGKCTFIVDYAHTISEVDAIFKYINKIKESKKIITIIGSGGNKDKSKRSVIANITCKNSFDVYFTEDNSRYELVEDIINDMINGLNMNNYHIIYNRQECINYVYRKYKNEDVIILVLGKGSEKYLIKNNVYYPYNDISVINNLYED